jgi:hypothetical protein
MLRRVGSLVGPCLDTATRHHSHAVSAGIALSGRYAAGVRARVGSSARAWMARSRRSPVKPARRGQPPCTLPIPCCPAIPTPVDPGVKLHVAHVVCRSRLGGHSRRYDCELSRRSEASGCGSGDGRAGSRPTPGVTRRVAPVWEPLSSTLAPLLPHERGHPDVYVNEERGDEQSPRGRRHDRDFVQPELHRDDKEQCAQLSPLPGLERAPRRRLGIGHGSQPSRTSIRDVATILLEPAPERLSLDEMAASCRPGSTQGRSSGSRGTGESPRA